MWCGAGSSRTWSPTRTTPLETFASRRFSRSGPTVSRHCAYRCACGMWGPRGSVRLGRALRRVTLIPKPVHIAREGERIHLRGQSLGSVPERLRTASRLKDLDLSQTGLTELPDWLWSLNQLERLNLAENRIAQVSDGI